jgi:hypothetical protein
MRSMSLSATQKEALTFHGQQRSNETHASKTDPDAKLARKGAGKEAKLSYSGSLLVETRNGLIVNAELLEANGRAERDAALLMLEQIPGTGRVMVGGDKGFDTAEFVAECRHLGVTPHVARNTGRRGGSAIDRRTTRHSAYAVSQRKRKRIEECLGWLKDIALMLKLRHRGLEKVDWSLPSRRQSTTWSACVIYERYAHKPSNRPEVCLTCLTYRPNKATNPLRVSSSFRLLLVVAGHSLPPKYCQTSYNMTNSKGNDQGFDGVVLILPITRAPRSNQANQSRHRRSRERVGL